MGAPGQGMGGAKSSRPSTLSSAIGRYVKNRFFLFLELVQPVFSALPIGAYGGLGRSAQGVMSPMSGYGASCEHHMTLM